jgi:hypothetical protein
MRSFKKIKKSIAEITEIALLLIAFGIVIQILFGNSVPLFGEIIWNLIGLLHTLGENGFIGLAVLGIVIFLFRKSKILA